MAFFLAAMLVTGPALAAEKIVIATLRATSAMPLFVAQDFGLFTAEGLAAELKFFEAGTPIPLAIVSGDADFAATAFTAALFNLAGKGALKIIGGTARGEKGYRQFGYVASPKAHGEGLRSLADLPGKSVGVTTIGAPYSYGIGLLAKKYGFNYAEVRQVALQTFPNSIAALKGGQVDAIVVPANLAVAIVDRGDGHVIGWDEETPWQLSGMFTSTRNIAERRATVEAFIRAYQKAARIVFDALLRLDGEAKPIIGPDHDRVLDVVARHAGQRPEQIKASLGYIDPEGRLKVQDVHDQIAFWQSIGLVDKSVDPRALMDLSFIAGHFELPK